MALSAEKSKKSPKTVARGLWSKGSAQSSEQGMPTVQKLDWSRRTLNKSKRGRPHPSKQINVTLFLGSWECVGISQAQAL